MESMQTILAVPEISVPSLQSSAILIAFTCGVPTLSRKDKRVTDETLIHNNAEAGAGKFTKSLLPNCKELKSLQDLEKRIRQAHYRWTLPWSDIGLRLCPTARFPEYVEVMTEFENKFRAGAQAVLDVYDWEIIQAKTKLGDMFDENAYPSIEVLEGKFKWIMEYSELPEQGDFRIDVSNEMRDILKSNYSNGHPQRIQKAMTHVVSKIRYALDKISTQLTENRPNKDTIGAPTLYEDGELKHRNSGVFELLELMRTCNIMQDTQIEAARVKLEEQFLGSGMALTREALKEDEALRTKTQAVVDDVLKNLPTLDL